VLARRSSQNKPIPFHLPRCALIVFIRRAVRCALIAYIRPAVHSCLHSLRSALIACIRHRGVVHSSPSFATPCTHRFHALATLCTHQLIAFIRHAVHSSPPFATLCTHRLHSPRYALIAFIPRAVHSLPWGAWEHIDHILSRCL
jgi:hypothetical protein